MKTQFRYRILLGLMFITALFSLVPTSVFATGQTAYLTPASGTSKPGDQFTISVDGYVGQQWWGGGANNATGTINFPAGLLKVVSTNTTGSTYTSDTITPDNGAGTISFNENASAWSPPANQSVHLFSVVFQSVAAGTASVQFGSITYTTGTPTTSGGTYTILAPPAPSPSPTPKPSASPKPAPTKPAVIVAPSPSPNPTPTVENTPTPTSNSDGGLKIDAVEVTANRTENSISWTLNNPAASPTLQYGTDKNNLKDAGAIPVLPDGSYKISLQNLKMGALYYFTIKAATSDGLEGATYNGTLTTRGYPVQLTIKQNNLLIPGAEVKIGSRTFVANGNSIVTTELGDGNITATITPPGATTTQDVQFVVKKVTVPKSGDPVTQNFALDIETVGVSSGHTTSIVPTLIGGIVGGIVILGGLGYGLFFVMKRNTRPAGQQSADVDTGQLSQAYGTDVSAYMTHTPEANLGGFARPVEVVNPVVSVPTDGTVMAAELPAGSTAPVDLAMQQEQEFTTIDTAASTVDPASLPLPPQTIDTQAQDLTNESYPEVAAAMTGEVNQPSESFADQPTSEVPEEQADTLSQKLAMVESSAPIENNNEPSAVFDASTGELDIIHHDHKEPLAVDMQPTEDVATVSPEETLPSEQLAVPTIETIVPADSTLTPEVFEPPHPPLNMPSQQGAA